MKIAIDLTSLADNLSGIERYASQMAKAMLDINQNDNEYILLFKDSIFSLFYEYESCENVSIRVIPSHGKSKLFFSQIILPRELKNTHADIALFLAFPVPLLYKRRSISTIHDLSCYDCPETMTKKSMLLWRALDTCAASGDKHVITISEFSKQRVIDHFRIDPDKVLVAYCGIDYDLFNQEFGRGREEEVRKKYHLPQEYILSLSTLEPRKNLPLLITAWAENWQANQKVPDLVLSGRKGWKLENLLSTVSEEAKQHIYVTGFVDDEDLPVLYRESRLFVYPSLYEGFGLPPVEAACSGATVLCSDIPCLKEICGSGVHYFESNNVDSLKKALLKNMESKTEQLTSRYSWSQEAYKIKTMLNSISRKGSC